MNAKKKYHHDDLRTTLLAKARDLIKENGIKGLSMRNLAKSAGVSHAAAYRHFKSKDELLFVLYLENHQRLAQQLKKARQTATGTAYDKLLALAQAYIEFGLSGRADLELMFSRAGKEAAQSYFASGKIKPEDIKDADGFAVLESVVAECVKEGFFPPDTNIGAASIFFWSQVHGYCHLVSSGVLGTMVAERGYSEPEARKAIYHFCSQLKTIPGK